MNWINIWFFFSSMYLVKMYVKNAKKNNRRNAWEIFCYNNVHWTYEYFVIKKTLQEKPVIWSIHQRDRYAFCYLIHDKSPHRLTITTINNTVRHFCNNISIHKRHWPLLRWTLILTTNWLNGFSLYSHSLLKWRVFVFHSKIELQVVECTLARCNKQIDENKPDEGEILFWGLS